MDYIKYHFFPYLMFSIAGKILFHEKKFKNYILCMYRTLPLLLRRERKARERGRRKLPLMRR